MNTQRLKKTIIKRGNGNEKDNVYILKTFPEGRIPQGSKLLSINDKPIDEIASELISYISTDGLVNLSAKRYSAGTIFELMYPKFFITPTTNIDLFI